MTAREEFNQMLNSCYHPRSTYNALLAFASTPITRQVDDISKKRSIVLSEVNNFINQEENNHD